MLTGQGNARVLLIGGMPLGPRHVWWNFVSSRRERIVQAACDWATQAFGAVPGEGQFIPVPDKRPTLSRPAACIGGLDRTAPDALNQSKV